MATIGRAAAVADLGLDAAVGLPGVAGVAVRPPVYLIEFENRVLVLTRWIIGVPHPGPRLAPDRARGRARRRARG